MTGAADQDNPGRESGGERVGSFAEEADKLFRVLGGLAQDQPGHGGGLGDDLGRLAHELTDHLAAAEECRYCPLCRLIAVTREPEVRHHLASAASSLAAALASALATQVPGERRGEPGGPPGNMDSGRA